MRHVMPILVVVVATFGVAISGAVAVLVLASGSCRLATEPITTRLIYQIDPATTAGVAAEQVAEALDRRLNGDRWLKSARIEVLPGGLIEVGVFGHDPGAPDRMDRMVRSMGKVEFLALAHASHHDEIIRLAADAGDLVYDRRGNLVGRWVEVLPEAELAAFTDGVQQRSIARGDQQIAQVLVVEDGGGVDGSAIRRAIAGLDDNGNPCVDIQFSDEGTLAMSRLTVPLVGTPWMGTPTRLGVLTDGKLISAPAIMTEIGNSVRITGRFDAAETVELADVLQSGVLPARLLLIERRVQP
jgi:hypothetical protein